MKEVKETRSCLPEFNQAYIIRGHIEDLNRIGEFIQQQPVTVVYTTTTARETRLYVKREREE